MKYVIFSFILIFYIGMFPRGLQIGAPSIFLVLGVIMYIIYDVIWKEIESKKEN